GIMPKQEQAEWYLEGVIKSALAQLDNVMKDRHFRRNEHVLTYQKDLEAAQLYKDRSDATAEGLLEMSLALEAHRAQLDNDLEEWTQREVEKWSMEVGYMRCIQSEPLMFRTFQVADVLDFEHVAKDFDEALERGSPEAIYRELHALQWEPEAVDKLDMAYQRKSHKTLETALKDHFGEFQQKAQLAYALQLINQGEIIEPLPSSFENLAMCLEAELTMSTIEPEKIYAMLTPFRRNTEWLSLLRDTCRTALEEKLQGESLRYALYLMGDQVLEKHARNWKEAIRLQKVLSELTFENNGVRIPVPNDTPLDSEPGAHMMCQALKEMGYASKKSFAYAYHINKSGEKQPNLHIRTQFAPDMLPGQDPTVTLRSHVAPLLQVETPCGIRELVLDPSLSNQALTVKNWMSKMSHETFERISFEEYQAKWNGEAQLNSIFSSFAERTYVFTSSRNYFFLPINNAGTYLGNLNAHSNKKLLTDLHAHECYDTKGKGMLRNKSTLAPYVRVAGFIRKNMHTIHDDPSAERFLNRMTTDFFKNVNQFHAISTSDFGSTFPNLSQALRAQLAETGVSAPIAKQFERFLFPKRTLSGQNLLYDRRFSMDRITLPTVDELKVFLLGNLHKEQEYYRGILPQEQYKRILPQAPSPQAGQKQGEMQQCPQEAKRIKLPYLFVYQTDKGTEIRGGHWTQARSREGAFYNGALYLSSSDEKEWLERYGIEHDVERLEHPNPDYNCFSYVFTNGEAGHLTDQQAEIALRENGYYPIAGWSYHGNHPLERWNNRKGYHPIMSSVGDPIITEELIRDSVSETPAEGDIIGYWMRDIETGKWFLSHLGVVSLVVGEGNAINICVVSKFGLLGLYKHLACIPTVSKKQSHETGARPEIFYGEAWTIYHSNRKEGRFIERKSKVDSQVVRTMKMLHDNNCRAIATKWDETLDPSEQPRAGDIIIYWLQKPDTDDWSPVHAGSIFDVTPDGDIIVSSEWETKQGQLKVYQHPAYDPGGFPYTTWVIYRLDTPSDMFLSLSNILVLG
ncbi:MAG TPA: protein-glutamine glutaminase family protein, partial [Ktedonobacteraceae bacterium]